MILEDRLRNWGRAQLSKMRQGQADSVEGNYRSDPNAAWADPPPPSKYPIDAEDAAMVEHAVCALSMFSHALLRYTYVDRYNDIGVCRLVEKVTGRHLHPYKDLPGFMDQALQLLTVQLQLPAVVRRERAKRRILRIRAELGLDNQNDVRKYEG